MFMIDSRFAVACAGCGARLFRPVRRQFIARQYQNQGGADADESRRSDKQLFELTTHAISRSGDGWLPMMLEFLTMTNGAGGWEADVLTPSKRTSAER